MKLITILCICLLLLSPFSVKAENSPLISESEKFGRLVKNYFEDYLKFDVITATFIGDNRYDDRFLNDVSYEFRAQKKDFYVKYLRELSAIYRNVLVGQDRLSYDTLRFDIETAIEGFKFNDHLTPIHQYGDMPTLFAIMGSGKSIQPFKTVRNYENFLGRIDGFQVWVETAIANMRKGSRTGIVQPRIVIERVLPQLEALLPSDIKKSLFFQPIDNFPANFAEADKERLTESYTRAINSKLYPSYRKLYAFLKNEYLPKTRSTVGLSAIPGGREEYAHLVKVVTTTDLTPTEIHNIGLREVSRIRAEMESIKNQMGFKRDLKAFFEFVRSDAQFFPFRTADDVLNAYRAIGVKLRANVPKLFRLVPKAELEVRATEKFREASSGEGYVVGLPDGSRPGVFYVPVRDPTKYSSIRMEALFLHEAIPGHHYQRSLQQEQTNLPRFRKFGEYTAYNEGWGLYAESLGGELGRYADAYQRLGMLTMDMMRSVRLVVDTGIHSKGWTREQAITYFLDNAPMTEAEVTAQIERYIARPGQALGYKIGQLKILELRRRSERSLGAQFELRDFHDEILKDGALPLEVLETKIDEWIAEQRQRSRSKEK